MSAGNEDEFMKLMESYHESDQELITLSEREFMEASKDEQINRK